MHFLRQNPNLTFPRLYQIAFSSTLSSPSTTLSASLHSSFYKSHSDPTKSMHNPIQSTFFSHYKYASGSFLPSKEGIFNLIASKSLSKLACPLTLQKFSLWLNWPLVLFSKSLRFLGCRKPSRWLMASSSKPLSPISPTSSSKS
jgi:hypothetical protein